MVRAGSLQSIGDLGKILAESDLVASLFIGEADLVGAHPFDDVGKVLEVGDRIVQRVGASSESVDVAREFAELVGDFGTDLSDSRIERTESGRNVVEV